MENDNLKNETANSTNTVLADSKIFSTEDVNKILDAYQVECQLKYNEGTVPDAREWFAKKFYSANDGKLKRLLLIKSSMSE